jgi:nicotinamidase-related amidase
MEEQRTTQASPHFKPETSALVLIDHQVGTMQLIKNLPADVSLRHAVARAKAAKAVGMPIVMTSSQELVGDWSTPAGEQMMPVLFASAPLFAVD